MGGAHSQVLAYFASPTSPPYVGIHTTKRFQRVVSLHTYWTTFIKINEREQLL